MVMDPAIGNVCRYLPTNPVLIGFAQKSPFWWLVPHQSSMCHCSQIYEQLILPLDMCATTCPQTLFEQVLSRNLLPEGVCSKSIKYVVSLTNLSKNWPCSLKFAPLPAHKPRPKRFCPEISVLGDLCKTNPLSAMACKLMNNWPISRCQKYFSWWFVQSQSSMCYCLPTTEQLALQLDMCANKRDLNRFCLEICFLVVFAPSINHLLLLTN